MADLTIKLKNKVIIVEWRSWRVMKLFGRSVVQLLWFGRLRKNVYFCGNKKDRAERQKLKKMKRALITGVTGQDGSFLSEFLLGKGYEVHGIIRRSSVDYRERIAHL